MENFNPHSYTITLKKVQLDEGEYFEAGIAELPDLVEYGETHEKAYLLAIDSITALYEIALEQDREFPEPMPSKTLEEFSGRVTLRMSKSLHAFVSKQADREMVSLNSWIVEAISTSAGMARSASTHKRAHLQAIESAYVVFVSSNVRQEKIINVDSLTLGKPSMAKNMTSCDEYFIAVLSADKDKNYTQKH